MCNEGSWGVYGVLGAFYEITRSEASFAIEEHSVLAVLDT